MQGETQSADGVMASVLMLTYNHGTFVEESVQSVLQQRCDFPFEIVVGDDASTDGTLSCLRSLEQRFPGRLRILP
jgi:glycosyltransferase involved in cell wall biosynthesis